jgi:hypothetical protein
MVEADKHLKLLPASILDINKRLSSTLISCQLAYGSSFTQIPTLLGSDFGIQGHTWIQNDVITSWLRLTPPQTIFHIHIRHIQVILYRIKLPPPSPPPLPLLLPPAVVVRRPSSAACFHHKIWHLLLLLAVVVTARSRHIVRRPAIWLVASSADLHPCDDIAAAPIPATPSSSRPLSLHRPLQIARSRHIFRPPPPLSPRPPPCSDRCRCAFRRPLSLCCPTTSATTSPPPLSP